MELTATRSRTAHEPSVIARRRKRPHRAPRSPVHRELTHPEVLDAASRVLLRRGYQGLLFGVVARELDASTRSVLRVVSDKPDLVRLCYRRSVEALESALMAAETTSGSGVHKLDVFLEHALATRRERGCLLPLALADGPTRADVRYCRDKDRMIRTRLERLIRSGQRDGSIITRDPAAACQLILAVLRSPEVPRVPERAAATSENLELKQLIFGGLATR